MGGLNLGVGGGVRLAGFGSSGSAQVAQVAYPVGATPTTGGGSGLQPWHLTIGASTAWLAVLIWLRWSLPRGGGR